MKLLVPVDVSHPHEDLVSHLQWMINLEGEEVVLLFVKEILPSYERVVESMADFPEDWQNQLEAKAKELLDKLVSKVNSAGASASIEIASGPTGSVINHLAKTQNFDLVAVAPGKGAHIRRFLLGSTSSQVVNHAPSSVLVLRDKEGQNELKHVVFAVDGSKDSEHAIEYTVKNLKMKERGIKASVVNVVSIAPVLGLISPAPFIATLETNLLMEGEVIVAAALNKLRSLGIIDVETKVKAGDPATELIAYADEHEAQLIVSGTKGHSAVSHILIGSVADRLSAHSNCANLVVKVPD